MENLDPPSPQIKDGRSGRSAFWASGDAQNARDMGMVACEQALLFGRVKRVSRERARLTSLTQTGELARRLWEWGCPYHCDSGVVANNDACVYHRAHVSKTRGQQEK